ncbi:DUF4185 domain-containing protein [Stackebrandtia nassauensis]|uniref:DUF4185 domain-containing protein n=1 Tax=Stackebrandtia nassauensis (strain DSM 44728 / CIP 108903 / NRRL B-16338 / NBRC 102104 / LLR-40K-21) TaxID=446470 RepID=D3Q3A8_STANL|nr:DUF4185 domain-containing protein [Stackebrandtia nassauensis]ADD41949.1 hypothetical protein Snas_2260 [Stackebrandtia nassauensis DSM 44728]
MITRTLSLTTALVTGLAVVAVPIAAQAAPERAPVVSASVNKELTQRFNSYAENAGRWTGADSAYSVDLPNGSTAWLYSDTFLGEVDENLGRPKDSPFVHNSIIVDDDGELTTHTGGTNAAPESLAKVAGADEKERWYWFGDGTVEGDSLRVMLLEFVKTGSGVFDFKFVGNAVASFDTDDMSLTGITNLPKSDVNWGSAIYEDRSDGYTYVFGVEDKQAQKYAHLARVPSGSLTTDDWEYFADGQWGDDPTGSTRILEGVSNEFSVSRFKGKFTIVTGDATEALSAKIVMYRGADIEGPYTGKTVLYQTPETSGNVFTYNAKAHPNLSSGNRLLVTYNVNSFRPDDLYEDATIYRPRYIDVTVKNLKG